MKRTNKNHGKDYKLAEISNRTRLEDIVNTIISKESLDPVGGTMTFSEVLFN